MSWKSQSHAQVALAFYFLFRSIEQDFDGKDPALSYFGKGIDSNVKSPEPLRYCAQIRVDS